MTFDNPHAHDFHLRHLKISQAMLRKWPTSGSCRPWFLAFYVKKKKGETEGKGSLGTGLATKKMGKRCIKTVDVVIIFILFTFNSGEEGSLGTSLPESAL